MVTEGFEIAKNKSLEVLDEIKVQSTMDRDMLINVAQTSLRTKVHPDLADLLTEVGYLTGFPLALENVTLEK